MARIGTLAINVIANTRRFSAGLDTASRDVRGFSGVVDRSMQSIVPFAKALGIGFVFGGAAALAQAGKSANEFAGTMNRSLAIMQDVGPKMRAEMERTAHSVAASTQFTAKESARAFFFLASAGMDAQASMGALQQMAFFGQAGDFDLATATDLATDAQSALGLKALDTSQNLKNLTRVTDVLTRANTLGNASIQQFSETLTNKAGAAAKIFGLEMEEVLGLAIAFADQGVKGAEAGTQIGIVLRDLSTKALINAKAFKKAGVEVWRYGELLPPAEIFKSLEKAMEGMNGEGVKTQLMALGFGDKSVAATQAVLGMSDAMETATEKLKTLGITAESVAESSLTDFDKAWNKIAASMNKASVETFTPIMKQLAEMGDLVDPAVISVDALANASGKVETTWTKIGNEVAGVMDNLAEIAGTMGLGAKAGIDLAKFPGDLAAIALSAKDSRGFDEQGRFKTGFGDELFNADFWAKGLKEIQARTARDLGLPDIVGGSLENLRRRGFDVDRVKLPDLSTQEKTEQELAKEASEAAAKLVLENAKSLSAASEELRTAQRHERFERGKDLNLAGERLTVQMRTPLEEFENKLIELRRIQKAVGASIDTTVMRAAMEAQKDFLGETKVDSRRLTPGLTPALEAGSVAAAEAIARSMQTSFPATAVEATAANTGRVAQLTPLMIRLLEQLNRKSGQPGTVETTAQ